MSYAAMMTMMSNPSAASPKGLFVTFEGVDGSGKTTQWQLATEALQQQQGENQVVATRNPGGTPLGQAIRQMLLEAPADKAPQPVAELLLYLADRAQHVAEVVQPALADGKIVLCDRFSDSTLAYQGAGRSLDTTTVALINRVACQGITPHLTLLFDADPTLLSERLHQRGKPDRMDRESLAFKHRVRNGFLQLAQQEPERIVVLDALQAIDTVHQQVMATLMTHLQRVQ